MKKIQLITTTRAEFGLFYWLIRALHESSDINFELIVTGNHLVPQQGYTLSEIEQENIPVTEVIDIMLAGDSAGAKAKSSALAALSFADMFQRRKPDLVIMMGDRYEILGIASSAAIMGIPIAHFSGGEITEGMLDDTVRHAVTRLSSWHFVTNAEHRRRVMQLGVHPDAVFNVGEPGLEHLLRTPRLTLSELSDSLEFLFTKPFFLCTFHPVPMDQGLTPSQQLDNVLNALTQFPNHQLLITHPNNDEGGAALFDQLLQFQTCFPERVKVVSSLGFRRYLSALSLCEAVIGNSSSGLVEAPSFHKPTVNIGNRQKGRMLCPSVLSVAANDTQAIAETITTAISAEHQEICQQVDNPYGDGHTVDKVMAVLLHQSVPTGRPFYDIVHPSQP